MYRVYPGNGEKVVVLIHGSGTESSVMNALAKTLLAAGITVYAPDLRGHGSSGRRGDIDYIGQLDDDLADLIATIRPEHANAALTLIGFSAGGAFTVRLRGASRRSLQSIHRDLPGHRLSVAARASERRWLGDALPASDRGPDHSQ
jgi:alpha-beta hydrolase superfamily lysophospholipase